jgi:hypothetical protein
MITKAIASIFLITLPVLIFSCKKEKADTEKPKITVNAPVEDAAYKVGETIPFDATFSDNIELSEYAIDIHSAAGHGHGRLMNTNEWDEEINGNLTGILQVVKRNIVVPTGADTGSYHFIVTCLDKAGNEADFAEVDFKIIE